MRRSLTRATVAVVAATSSIFLTTAPAHATVHEIVAQWCSGHAPLEPHGITGGSHADNFAQPLKSTGFIGPVVAFDPPGDQVAGQLITFNYDVPNAKVVGTGTYIAVGSTPGGPLYIEAIVPNPEFAAFAHCPMLAG